MSCWENSCLKKCKFKLIIETMTKFELRHSYCGPHRVSRKYSQQLQWDPVLILALPERIQKDSLRSEWVWFVTEGQIGCSYSGSRSKTANPELRIFDVRNFRWRAWNSANFALPQRLSWAKQVLKLENWGLKLHLDEHKTVWEVPLVIQKGYCRIHDGTRPDEQLYPILKLKSFHWS